MGRIFHGIPLVSVSFCLLATVRLAARNVRILVALMTNGLCTRHYLTGFELTNFEHKKILTLTQNINNYTCTRVCTGYGKPGSS